MVGPKVGSELKRKGLASVVSALAMVFVYIVVRFQPEYGAGAILALTHDVIITLGIFSVTQREVTLPIVAAILTIVGYSLNDTIVVFDRIRENLSRFRREVYTKVVNQSLNETLSRTILTSITTLIVVLALFLFGGGVIHDFAFAMIIGVLVGTYSSIFVATARPHRLERAVPRLPAERLTAGTGSPGLGPSTDDPRGRDHRRDPCGRVTTTPTRLHLVRSECPGAPPQSRLLARSRRSPVRSSSCSPGDPGRADRARDVPEGTSARSRTRRLAPVEGRSRLTTR